MARAAADAGLSILGLTEHAPGVPGTVDPTYYRNLSAVLRELYGVHLLHGCEINVLNGGNLSLELKYVDYLDYAIVGIHRQCYENEGVVGNTDNLIACMENEKVRFVSHPDDNTTPLDYPALVQAAKAYGVALESTTVRCESRSGAWAAWRTTAPCSRCAPSTACQWRWTPTRTTPARWATLRWRGRCWSASSSTPRWSSTPTKAG